MIRAVKNWLHRLSMTEQEVYLSKSKDLADLERRQRELDRRQFTGGSFRSLYNRFYL